MSFTSGFIRPQSSTLSLLVRLLDGFSIVFAMSALLYAYDVRLDAEYMLVMGFSFVSYMLMAEWRKLYQFPRMEGFGKDCAHIASIWFTLVTLLMAMGFITKTSAHFSRVVLFIWMLGVPAMMCFVRFWLQKAAVADVRTVAFAGVGATTDKLATLIAESPWLGLKIIGAYDDHCADCPDMGELHRNGNLQALCDLAHAGGVDVIYVTLPLAEEKRIVQLIEKLSDTTVSVYMVPDLFLFALYEAHWVSMSGLPVISLFESPFNGIDSKVKRIEDLVLGSLILILISPLLLVIAAMVKATSPGAIIFKQRRYGLNGDVVEIWKFRSMTVCEDGLFVTQAIKNDERLTRVGEFLRRHSLDELPQFFNVLQGTMSIVGPRPHAVVHNEMYRKLIRGYMLRHMVKPGITGYAQVNGYRGETDTLEKMQGRIKLDLIYIQKWSLWLDIKIIFKTVLVGFSGKNTY